MKSRITPRFKCGKDSETMLVRVGVLSDCAALISRSRIEIVLLADVPPCTARIRRVNRLILAVAVVTWNIEDRNGSLIIRVAAMLKAAWDYVRSEFTGHLGVKLSFAAV